MNIYTTFFLSCVLQTVFDPMFISVYNLFYTSLPVLALGMFDQDVNDRNSLAYPQLYTPGHRNLLFNKKEFLLSAIHGFFTSCVLFLVPFGKQISLLLLLIIVLSYTFIFSETLILYSCFCFSGTYKDAVDPTGQVLSDHMLFGSVVATILVIVVTAQVCVLFVVFIIFYGVFFMLFIHT